MPGRRNTLPHRRLSLRIGQGHADRTRRPAVHRTRSRAAFARERDRVRRTGKTARHRPAARRTVRAARKRPRRCQVRQARHPTKIGIRLFHTQIEVAVENNFLFAVSGNNVSTSADMGRSFMRARIDTGLEHPDRTQFNFDPREELTVQWPRPDRRRPLTTGPPLRFLRRMDQDFARRLVSLGLPDIIFSNDDAMSSSGYNTNTVTLPHNSAPASNSAVVIFNPLYG